ncbi:MAG: DUF6383 domain-containing protein [Dysgonamonadaceae bacterium]|nr:DUF6383 domain-containing protein [Dysgonamonadaceae bacterium]
MKKLFTILLSSLIITNLLGQVPVAIVGDMYVADQGKFLSVGPVHVRADSTENGRIDNELGATLSFRDSLILYSNDVRDGLLMNVGLGTAIEAGGPVLVRKLFTGNDDNGWHPISFPFNVYLDSIKVPSTKAPAIYGNRTLSGSQYWIAEFDTVNRAYEGLTTDNWKWFPADAELMEKGVGYRMTRDVNYGGNTDMELDFVVRQQDLAELFNAAPKLKRLSFADRGRLPDDFVDNKGWSIIGGLNTSSFAMNSATINYSGTAIWYMATDGKTRTTSGYQQVFISTVSIDETPILSPYVPFYVQVADSGTYMVFNPAGLSLLNTSDLPDNRHLFRSVEQTEDLTKDVLYLSVSDQNNKFERIYILLSDTYDENFMPGEDALNLATTNSSSPALWSITTDRGKILPLFVNRLPRVNGTREIKLGLSVPAAGEYTFDLRDLVNNKVRSALLLDKETNKQTELLVSPYSFKTSAPGLFDNRFVLYINKVATAIDQPKISETEVYAYTNNNVLTVKNLLIGNKVQVVDLTGRTIAIGVATGDEFSVPLGQKGVYIVNVTGEKAAVRKVLNK